MSRSPRWAITLALALACSACGGDKAAPAKTTSGAPKVVSVDKWADQACAAMKRYSKGARNPDDLEPSLASATRISEARFEVESFFRDYSIRADQLVFDLQASDIPDVNGGAEARKVFNSYFERAATALGSVQSRINEVGVQGDPATFRDRVSAIMAESQTAFVTNDLEKFAAVNEPMYTAFINHPVCMSVPYGILP